MTYINLLFLGLYEHDILYTSEWKIKSIFVAGACSCGYFGNICAAKGGDGGIVGRESEQIIRDDYKCLQKDICEAPKCCIGADPHSTKGTLGKSLDLELINMLQDVVVAPGSGYTLPGSLRQTSEITLSCKNYFIYSILTYIFIVNS